MRSAATGCASGGRGRRHEEWVMESTAGLKGKPGGKPWGKPRGLMVYPDEEATLAMNHSAIDPDLDGPRPMPQKIRSMLKPDYSV